MSITKTPRHTDGRRYCHQYLVDGECTFPACKFAHVPRPERAACVAFARTQFCDDRGCVLAHNIARGPAMASVGLKCEWTLKERITEWLTKLCPWLEFLGFYADTPARKSPVLLLFQGPRPRDAIAAIQSDLLLSRFVDKILVLGSAAGDLSELAAHLSATLTASHGVDVKTIRLQMAPPRIRDELVALFDTAPLLTCARPSPAHFSHTVHVAFANGLFHYGVSDDLDLAQFAAAPPAYAHIQTIPPLICRAQLKMVEILRLVPVQQSWHVLDIGASPGGWVTCVAALAAPCDAPAGHIIAVDPAELSDLVPSRVVHMRKLSSDPAVHADIAELMADSQLHFVTCDANADPTQCVSFVMAFVDLMASDAFVAITCKKFSHEPFAQVVAAAKAALEQASFMVLHDVKLLANTDSERTLIARRQLQPI